MILGGLLALAALSAAAGDAAPADGARFRLETLHTELASAEAALSGGGSACPSADALVKDDAAGVLSREASAALGAANEDLRLLFTCRAAAARSARACAPLGTRPARLAFEENRPMPTARPETLRFLCESDLHDLGMVRARAAGSRKDFVAACLEHDASGHRDFLPGKASEACAILADGDKDPEAACAKLAPLYTSGLPGTYCRGELAFFAGEKERCAGLGAQKADQELCLAAAAYARRREAPAACADSPVCSALSTGQSGACAAYETRAVARACREHYLPRALDASLARLAALDKELEAAAVDPASRLDAELEAAARLRLRAEAFRVRLSAAQKPSGVPAAAPGDATPNEPRLAALEGAARGAGHRACLANATPAEVMSVLNDPATSPTARGVLLNASRPWLERLYNARAFAAGAPAVCDELAPLAVVVHREKDAGDISLDLLCKTNYYEGLMAGAIIRGEPEVFELCRKRNLVGDRDFRLDSLDVSCRIIAESKGGVAATCEALGPYFDNLTIGATCPRMLRYANGDPTVCPLFEDEMVRERCEGYVAYRKSGTKDAKACGGKSQCELLKGDRTGPETRAAAGLARAACGVYARADVRAELATRIAAQAEAQARALSEAGADDAAVELAARLQARALRAAEAK